MVGVLAGTAFAVALTLVAKTWLRIARAGKARTPGHGDVIAVFGAGLVDGRPCAELRGRLAYAMELYEHARAPRILCLGGPGEESGAMATELVRQGVPPEAVATDATAGSTRRGVLAIERLAAQRRVLVVSSPYHMRRIVSEGARRGVDLVPAPPPVDRVTLSSVVRVGQTAREVAAIWWYALTFRR